MAVKNLRILQGKRVILRDHLRQLLFALEKGALLVAFINGLFYLFLVPPWQHYDEPTHFEYVWLIANRRSLPSEGDYDQDFRREVAASMIEHNFFRGMDFKPNLLSQSEPVWLGVSELSHPPLYYLLVALILTWVSHADVTFQLYLARFASLMLYLLTIWVARKIVSELTPSGHFLRWVVPLSLVFLPAYTELMTAVNNDVGAVAIFSLFVWSAIRLVMRGLSWRRVLGLFLSAFLCFWTKNTVALALWVAPLAVILAVLRRARFRWQFLTLFAWLALPLALILDWGDAAFWYRYTVQDRPTRDVRAEAPIGSGVLVLEVDPNNTERRLMQPIPREILDNLRGREVTLGAWIWASSEVEIRSPILNDGIRSFWRPLQIGTTPTFYAITATISHDSRDLRVVLEPSPEQTQGKVILYYDGLVLAEGLYPSDQTPLFEDPGGKRGTWGGETFVNHLRNGTVEHSWLRLRGWLRWLDRETRQHIRIPADIDTFIGALMDIEWSGWIYVPTARILIHSFWAYFGWGHVRLPYTWFYSLLEGITLAGVLGGVVLIGRRWIRMSTTEKAVFLFLLVVFVLIWLNALLRVIPNMFLRPNPLLPVARYAFPAVIPTMLLLIMGWSGNLPGGVRKWTAMLLLLALFITNIISLITIHRFYSMA